MLASLGALLGVGAYRLQQRGELTWKVCGVWAGVVGLFGVGDWFVSQYVFFLRFSRLSWKYIANGDLLDTSSRSTRRSNTFAHKATISFYGSVIRLVSPLELFPAELGLMFIRLSPHLGFFGTAGR